jgi:hypothetical protein
MKAKPAGRFYRFCSNNGPFVVFGKMLGESRRQREKGDSQREKEERQLERKAQKSKQI